MLFVFLLAAPPAQEIVFERDVRPILRQQCVHCHGEEPKPKGKFDVRTAKVMLRGGRSGAGIVPGKPEESVLWEKIESDEMPEGPKKLSAVQKATIKSWILQGAKTAKAEPDDPAAARFSDDELNHWAFQPVQAQKVPAGAAQSIDAFLLAKLKHAGFGFNTPAEKRTLIRRATFDLIGLPPTTAEVEAFVNDDSKDAFAKVIDRLLASPHYGERWGRHWLDVAGYSETDGNPGNTDRDRPHAWRFRDYVVRSFNADKPYNTFLLEQLAGDELAARPIDPANAKTVEHLTAVGFLRMAPDVTATNDSPTDRTQAVADMLKVVGSSVLGLTVGCAQCHDHKYDPIPTKDYYRLRAVFTPAFDVAKWKKPDERLVDVTPAPAKGLADAIEAYALFRQSRLDRAAMQVAEAAFQKVVLAVPAADRQAVEAAARLAEEKRSPTQVKLLEKYPTVKNPYSIRFQLTEYDRPAHERFKAWEKSIEQTRSWKPAPEYAMGPVEQPGPLPKTHVLHRGDPEQPRDEVQPADLFVIAKGKALEAKPAPESSGRRLAFARYLTDGRHPLTARVIVNRVWMHHFGRGIVATPGDFGLNGDRPSHPELLDWLAADFMQHGWSLKRLHRQLMLSLAYSQSSARRVDLDRLDPDNKLLGRMPVRRLEAEAVRDAVLAVSGKLNRSVGGPSVPVAEDGEGKAVFGKRLLNDGLFNGIEPVGDAAFRRSLYVSSKRALPLAMLETFDLPVMTPNCDARRSSTVATQSLLFLNDTFIVESADELAEQIMKLGNDRAAKIDGAFAVKPSDAERTACLAFVAKQEKFFQKYADPKWQKTLKEWPHAAELQAFAALGQTLLASNRFLYVD
jgi:hypothetical protein